MAWTIRYLPHWDAFSKVAGAYGNASFHGFDTRFLFRGQSRASWGLATKLQRSLGSLTDFPSEATALEKACLRRFQQDAPIHLPPTLNFSRHDIGAWWTIMQHYGAPTRLLDWTRSMYVAAYFASAHNHDSDGAIWLFAAPTFVNAFKTEESGNKFASMNDWVFSEKPSNRLMFLDLLQAKFERLRIQQGVFTFPEYVFCDAEKSIEEAFTAIGRTDDCVKFVIAKEAKLDIIKHLQAMNITADTLFPGMDGLGRTLEETLTQAVAAIQQRNLKLKSPPR